MAQLDIDDQFVLFEDEPRVKKEKKNMTPTVTLVNVTQNAMEMLILAKSTRLEMSPHLIQKIFKMSDEEKRQEVSYIANTIPSSWEFVDFTFLVCNVTRAYTHQQVRTRTASYAQQAMRITDMSKGFDYSTGPSIADNEDLKENYDAGMTFIRATYKYLVDHGATIQDARGLLPTNIGTNILIKLNLRAFVDLCHKRSSSRVQDEYREVVRQMKEVVIKELPWVEEFVNKTFDKAASELDKMIGEIPNVFVDADYKMKMVKLLDQMRMKS